MSRIESAEPSLTVFQRAWNKSDDYLFRSERHGVMALPDSYPKMPLQVVIAPAEGDAGEVVHFYDLELGVQRKLHEVGFMIGAKIMDHCAPDERSMMSLEGFGVPDHAHLTYYKGVRRQGLDRYLGECLGPDAVAQTRELLTFTPADTELLEYRLDQIDLIS